MYLVVRRKRGQAVNSTALALLRAAALGLLAWLFSLMAWLALEIGLGGRVHLTIEALVGEIERALHALGAGDRGLAVQIIEAALPHAAN